MKAEHGQLLCVMPNGAQVYRTAPGTGCACGLIPPDSRIANRPGNPQWKGVPAWFDNAARRGQGR